jgi:hypothetical protein
MLWKLGFAHFVVPFRDGFRVVISHPDRPIEFTGDPKTTLGNTLDVGCGSAHVFIDEGVCCAAMLNRTDLIQAAYRLKTGLSMKVRIFFNFDEPTFLKGSWWPTVSGARQWSVRPSRILKAGIALQDPRAVHVVRRKGVYKKLSAEEAGRRQLASVANTYAQFPAVPILRAFVDRFRDDTVKTARLEPHKVQPSALFEEPDMSRCLYMAARSYRMDPSWFLEMEAQILQSSPYTLLTHPGYLTLAESDYS